MTIEADGAALERVAWSRRTTRPLAAALKKRSGRNSRNA
jgi:hypothetical protein